MSDAAIRERVKQFIQKNFYVADPTKLKDEVSLLEQGVMDSTGVLEVIGFLEQTFEIKIDDEEMLPENLDSVTRITAFVERKKAA